MFLFFGSIHGTWPISSTEASHSVYIRYFRSKCSMCSLARMRRDTILVFLESPSSILFKPPNKLWIADETCSEETADSACAEEKNCEYGTPEGDSDGDDVIGAAGDIEPILLPDKCVDIQGSRGKVELLPLLVIVEIVDNGKPSVSLKPPLSSFSWRRHFARLFWNQTWNKWLKIRKVAYLQSNWNTYVFGVTGRLNGHTSTYTGAWRQ